MSPKKLSTAGFARPSEKPALTQEQFLKAGTKRREAQGERTAVYLPPDLAQKLRVRCAIERRSLSDAATEALTAWMKGFSAESTKP